MVETFNPSTLNLTEGAVNKIHSLSDSDKSKEINLRVYVTGGGCSGFQYGFSFDKKLMKKIPVFQGMGQTWLLTP